ncbi:MAG: WD40 repeat domain-containing protein, partial [Acholeplasmataceae bacterium]|nr:WD40 repeat domain-containing protein [Acholeplasmataceae bacterium]
SLAISKDAHFIASGCRDNTIEIWDVATGEVLHILRGHQDSVNVLAFSPDSCLLASGSADKTVRIWNVNTGLSMRTIDGHNASVISISFSPDGKTIASGGMERTVYVWNVLTGEGVTEFDAHGEFVRAVAFSPDGKTIATGGADCSQNYDADDNDEYDEDEDNMNDEAPYSANFWDDNWMNTHTVKFWDVKTDEIAHMFMGNGGFEGFITCIVYNQDGLVLIASEGGAAIVYDVLRDYEYKFHLEFPYKKNKQKYSETRNFT